MNYGERLKMYRKHAGLTQKELAQKIGVDNTVISHWERGQNRLDIDMLGDLALALNITVNDLLGFYTDFSLNGQEEKLMRIFRDLDDSDKETFMKLGEALKVIKNSKNKAVNRRILSYPVHATPASAGPGSFLDSDDYDLIDFPENEVPRESNFAVRVSGNSMEPEYKHGSIVFIKQTKDIAPGEVGLFIINNEGFIKIRGESNNLKSINPEYKDIILNQYDDCRIVGKVVGKYEE